jgi:hypothetical protein
VGGHHAPTALLPGKTRYPLYRRLGGPQEQSGHVQKILPPEFKKQLHKAGHHLYLTLCSEHHTALRVYLMLRAEVLIMKCAQRSIITVCAEMLVTKYVAYDMAVVYIAHAYAFTVDCGLCFVTSKRQYVKCNTVPHTFVDQI